MKLSKIVLGLAACAMILVTASCSKKEAGNGAAEVSVIKIGSLHPISGSSALEGQQMNDAVMMAVEEINAAGGIKSLGGAKVEVVVGDHEMKAEKGVSEVQRMVREGVVGVLGSYSSGVTLSATQECERQKIPFVTTISAVDSVTERGFKYTFRLQPPASVMADNFLKFYPALNEAFGGELKTAVIAHEQSVFGSSIAAYLEEHAPEVGLEILEVMPHSAGAAELTSDVNKIKSLNPDLVIPITYLGDGKLLFQTMKSSNFAPKAIVGVANGAISNASFISGETELNQYLMDVNYTINPKSALADKVKADYLAATGKEMGPNAAYSYEATKVLLQAVEAAGTTDTTAIMEALRKTSYTDHILPQEAVVFGEDGQNKNAAAVMSQIIDGKSLVVFPEEFKQTDIIVQ